MEAYLVAGSPVAAEVEAESSAVAARASVALMETAVAGAGAVMA